MAADTPPPLILHILVIGFHHKRGSQVRAHIVVATAVRRWSTAIRPLLAAATCRLCGNMYLVWRCPMVRTM
jgi:hypothetical protein